MAAPGDLLAGGGIEEPVAIHGDDHDQVMPVTWMDREADAL
jgi:hypothetical protein